MSRTRLPLILALLSALFGSVLLPTVTNILTGILPESWQTSLKDHFFEVTVVAIALAVISVGLYVWQYMLDRPADEVRAGGRTIDTNRKRMLEIVRETWIDGYLKHSLDNLARIKLGLEENPNAVSRPWDAIVQQPGRAPRPLPLGQTMSTIFDELGQALLILGAPGAGKTTLLLELTRDLLDRAEQDASYPMPVVFHLSSWAVRRRPLADWLVDELAERYYIPRKLAQAWADAEQVLPLLDGLDEVASEHRAECVEAINTFRRQHGLVPLALCSRAVDYQALSARVELSGAVAIEPLSRVQVSTYLKQAGKPLVGVRTALRDDEALWELLDTPLMLSIVTLAYRGRSAAEVRATGSLEERRAHLFANYTERMFERRTKITEYTREQTIRWLAWLACSMMQNNLSVFYVEWMQPDWLPSRAQRWVVAMMPIIFCGLVFGLVFGLVVGLVGLVVRWVGKLPNHITPAETIRWSWTRAREGFADGVEVVAAVGPAVGLVVGLISGLVGGGLVFGLISGLIGGTVGGLSMAPTIGLVFGLLKGLVSDEIVNRMVPNEGIQRSLRNAQISFLSSWLAFGLFYGLFWLIAGPMIDGSLIIKGLIAGLLVGPFPGLFIGMQKGGSAYLKHYVLRILLWRNDYAPWNYIRFLDYAAERVFLRRVGGGYIFTHRLMMEYFATLKPIGQAKADSGSGPGQQSRLQISA